MSLASYEAAKSPTELSESPLYHYHYSNNSKIVKHLSEDEEEYKQVQAYIQSHCFSYYEWGTSGHLVLQTDTTPVIKAHSPTLEDRTYIPIPNTVIHGNKPLSIGYEVSCINVSSENWSLPMSMERVASNETATQKALSQLGELLSHPELNLSTQLCVNTLDSKYGNSAYLSPAFAHDNLLSAVRLKSGMKVYKRDIRTNTGGANGIYGQKYYLIEQSDTKSYNRHPRTGLPYEVERNAILSVKSDERITLEGSTKSGKAIYIFIRRWNDMMLRTSKGHNMKDKPFDLINVQVREKQTGKPVFKRRMFLAISGKRKEELSTADAYRAYRKRYDIEPYFRFAKQQLMLDKFQTPDRRHFDNWLLIQQLTAWLLYTASDEADFKAKAWRKYLPENKIEQGQRLTIAQTRHAAESLFLTFDPEPFKPVKSKKGRPREKGETQNQRTEYPVVKKTTGKKPDT